MKIAVVNDIHVGKCLEHQGKVRASSHLVEEMLKRFLQEIIYQHAPDVLINLGDLIRSENEQSDLMRYARLIADFQHLQCPIIHLVGNHELKKIPLQEIELIWQQMGFDQKSYGCQHMGHFSLIWLGLEADAHHHSIRRLPTDQLHWLKEQLNQIKQPIIIFTHCAIDDHDVNGNFFYEASEKSNRRTLFLENQETIRNMINDSNCVIAVLQAHLHYFHTKVIKGIPYITCPAMGDNICGPHVRDNIPEIYTILTFENQRVTAKAYSGQYCFAGYEGAENV